MCDTSILLSVTLVIYDKIMKYVSMNVAQSNRFFRQEPSHGHVLWTQPSPRNFWGRHHHQIFATRRRHPRFQDLERFALARNIENRQNQSQLYEVTEEINYKRNVTIRQQTDHFVDQQRIFFVVTPS